MNIYIPIEVKVRELEGRGLLALVAAERGHTVILGEKKDTINMAKHGLLPPGIVHDKSLTPGDYKIENFQLLKKHGHMITAQDEESGLLDESFDVFAKQRFSKATLTLADKVFAWGLHDKNSLCAIYPEFAGNIVTTGSPRVDFWRKEFSRYFGQQAMPNKPYIFIVSNFGSPLDMNTLWDRVARLREAGYFERDLNMERYMYENTAYQLKLLYHFIEMVRHLSKVYPGNSILLRPHPVESVDGWKKLVGSFPNVVIERKGTISKWIRNSSVLIHNGCTSAIEAAAAGIPRVAYRPIPHELERDIPNQTSINAFSIEEITYHISEILKGKKTSAEKEAEISAGKILEQRFANTAGKFSADIIVDEWEKIGKSAGLRTSTINELRDCKIPETISLKKKIIKKAVNLKHLIFQPAKKENKGGKLLNTSHKFPSLNDEEMQELVEKLQLTLNRFQDVEFVRFGEKSFILYSKKYN